MKPTTDWRKVLLLVAPVLFSGALAGSQSFSAWGAEWWYSNHFWPTFISLVIPAYLAFGLIAYTNNAWLAGAQGAFARNCAWMALVARLACLVIIPVAMVLWGYPQDSERKGLLTTDALNASTTAWNRAQEPASLLSVWQPGEGDNTGGITVLGVAMFRIFSFDLERPLLLGILASAITSLTVVVVFRLALLLFSQNVARIAALIVAIYPEGVLIGSAHQQQGYLALLLGVLFLAVSALILKRQPEDAGVQMPAKGISLLLLAGSLLAFFFISGQFLLLAILCGVIFAVWLSDPREKLGKILWGGIALVAFILIILRILSLADVISGDIDPLLVQYKFLFGQAWLEYDKLAAAGGGDMFQQVFSTLERADAFTIAALYGLLQPALPAAIGYRNLGSIGGGFWQAISIFRSLGWYLLLPVLGYGSLKALGGWRRRDPVLVLAVLFWILAFVSSYRAFGDQWDNPRYRLFAMIPMALVAAWAWVKAGESRDPWFLRIVIPFAVAVVGLTVWYLLRYYFAVELPVLYSLAGMAVLTVAAFIVTLVLTRRGKSLAAG